MKNIPQNKISILLAFWLIKVSIPVVYAQNTLTAQGALDDPTLGSVKGMIEYATGFLLGLLSIFAILFVILGGGDYIWGWSSETKQAGKKKITFAIAGLLVVAFSYIIVKTIIGLL